MSKLILPCALVLAACGGVQYTATLNGASEVPAVTTNATGSVTLTLDGTKLDVAGTYSGLSGAPSAAHIHGPAATTATAGVACTITAADGSTVGTGTISGECDVQEAAAAGKIDTANLNNGQFYVNVHTTANGGGEIRGQLTKK
jgi:hypothetical protein